MDLQKFALRDHGHDTVFWPRRGCAAAPLPPDRRMLLSKKYGCANISFTHDPMSVIASSNKVGGRSRA